MRFDRVDECVGSSNEHAAPDIRQVLAHCVYACFRWCKAIAANRGDKAADRVWS